MTENHYSLSSVDVFDGQSEIEVQSVYERILALREWNEKRINVFQILRNVPGNGFAFFEGIFGCGKTLVQAALAKLLIELGKHVLIVAPTNTALQALSNTIFEALPELHAVRVVFAGAEKKLQSQNSDYAMLHLLQKMAASRVSTYDVLREHDLQTHVVHLVQTKLEAGETLMSKYKPEDKDVSIIFDEPDEEH